MLDKFWQYALLRLSRAVRADLAIEYIADGHGALKLVKIHLIGAQEAGYKDVIAVVDRWDLFPILATGHSIGDCWMLACTPESVTPECDLPSFVTVMRDLQVDDIGPLV